MREQPNSGLSDGCVVNGYQIRQLNERLLLEFSHVDGKALHNLRAGQIGALRQLKRRVSGRHGIIIKLLGQVGNVHWTLKSKIRP